MVLTKAYLRYLQTACVGVVCSLRANVVFIRRKIGASSKQFTQYAACPALENVIIWDVRRGEKVAGFQFTIVSRVNLVCFPFPSVTI